MKLNGILASIIVFGVLVLATTLFMRHEPRLVVIDMTRAIQEPASRLAHSNHPESAQKALMRRYTKLLPEEIEAYSESHHVTILSARVLSSQNTLDITPIMIQKTIQRLKHEK